MPDSNRRSALAGLGSAAAMLAGRGQALAAADGTGLHAHALRRGMSFGCAMRAVHLENDALREAVVRECGVLVPENEMKWPVTEMVRGRFTFEAVEKLVSFARANGLALRGHNAIWHQNMPAWAAAAIAGDPDGGDVFDGRVRGLLQRFRGRVTSWDVVNEAVEPSDKRPDGLRDTVYVKRFGPDFLVRAFQVARAAAPDAQLVYNDYGLEYSTSFEDERRRATLAILERLRREKLVDGLGVQSHLTVGNNFQPKVFRRFLADAADLGVEILLTEMSVNDRRLPSDIPGRDRQVCDHAARYLDTAFDERATKTLITWGLNIRDTFLNIPGVARADGLFHRGLPLDENMNRIPLWTTIAKAFDDAPSRR